MRLTFVPADGLVIINGEPVTVDMSMIDAPDGLHAVQHYPATADQPSVTELEWTDEYRSIGNSIGAAGLPGGSAFIDLLMELHAARLAEAEEEVLEPDSKPAY